MRLLPLIALIVFATSSPAQSQSYAARTVVGRSLITDGAPAPEAYFREARKIAYGPKGELFVVDRRDSRVRRIDAAGKIYNFVGGNYGCLTTATTVETACFDRPISIAFDSTGNAFVGEESGRIQRIDAATGVVSHFAGSGASGFSGDGELAIRASFIPDDLAVDREGNLFGVHRSAGRIFRIDAATKIFRHLAGSGRSAPPDESLAPREQFIGNPGGIAIDSRGNVYFCDSAARAIRRISPAGLLTAAAPVTLQLFGALVRLDARERILIAAGATLYQQDETGRFVLMAGRPNFSTSSVPEGQVAADTPFPGIAALAVGVQGGITILAGPSVVRIDDSGKVRIVAGRARPTAPSDPGVDRATFAFNLPTGATILRDGTMMIAHNASTSMFGEQSLVWATNSAVQNRFIGSSFQDFFGPRAAHSIVQRDGVPIYSEDFGTAVSRLTPFNQRELIAGIPREPTRPCFVANRELVAGTRATSECVVGPRGIAVAPNGDLYIADYGGAVVRRVTPTGGMYAVAGNTARDYSGDRALATAAGMDPNDVAVDASGNVFIADFKNHRIRRVDAASSIITTIAGTGIQGFSGDGGPASSAQLNFPTGLEFDSAGNLLIADWGNARLRRLERDGTIRTIAGTGRREFNVESGAALATNLSPYDLFKDTGGNLYVIDRENDRIRALTVLTPVRLTIVGGDNQTGTLRTPLPQPLRVRVVNAEGFGVGGVRVEFRIESGAATLSAGAAVTGDDGIASTQLTVGTAEGTIAVSANAPGLAAIRFTLTADSAPVIRAVTGAALTQAAAGKLSPGGLATIFGIEFAAPGTLRQLEPADLDARRLPTLLSLTCVEIGATRAPLFLVSPSQINFQVPAGLAAGATEVRVIRGCGSAPEKRSAAFAATIVQNAPEFFAFKAPEDGRFPVAAVDSVTGELIGPAGLIPGVSTRPVQPGGFVTVYGTGFGPGEGGVVAGEVPLAAARVAAPVEVRLDGETLNPSDVLYAGVTPGSAGLFQLNLRIPETASPGLRSLVIVLGGAASDISAYLAVGR